MEFQIGRMPGLILGGIIIAVCVCTSAHVYAEGCVRDITTTEPDCENDLNCSQTEKFPGGGYFKCEIKRMKGWKQFENEYGPFTDITNDTDMKTLRITGIEWYQRKYDKNKYNPTLKFTFIYPNYINATAKNKNSTGETEYRAKAVKMTWRGINDPYHFDTFYSLVERIRLFDFHTYGGTTYDNYHPKSITFPCITGLDTCNSNKKYYTLDLAALAFLPRPVTANITFYVTTFNQQGEEWQPAIATAVFPKSCSVYVVFEPAPESDNIERYEIILTNMRSRENFTRERRTQFTAEFDISERGLYELQIVAYGGKCSSSTCLFKAREVSVTADSCSDAGSSSDLITAHTTTGNVDSMKIVFAMVGVVGSLILLAFVFCLIKQRKCPKNPPEPGTKTLFILYSNMRRCDEELVKNLANWIREKCPSFDVIWDQNGNSDICNDVDLWYSTQLDKASRVMVICPSSWEERRINIHTPIQPYFRKALDFAYNYCINNGKDNKWMFFLCFKFSDQINIPIYLKDKRKYRLPEETSKVCKCLKNKSTSNPFKSYSLISSESGKKLLGAMERCQYIHQNNRRISPIIEEEQVSVHEFYESWPKNEKGAEIPVSKDCPIHGLEATCPIHGKKDFPQNPLDEREEDEFQQQSRVYGKKKHDPGMQTSSACFATVAEEDRCSDDELFGNGDTVLQRSDFDTEVSHSHEENWYLDNDVSPDTYVENDLNFVRSRTPTHMPCQHNNFNNCSIHQRLQQYRLCDYIHCSNCHMGLPLHQCQGHHLNDPASASSAGYFEESQNRDIRKEESELLLNIDDNQETDDILKMFEAINFQNDNFF